MPLIQADIARPWSSELFAFDPSLARFGICSMPPDSARVANIGRMKEIARFREALTGNADHRKRALTTTRTSHDPQERECADPFLETPYFEGVPGNLLCDRVWNTLVP